MKLRRIFHVEFRRRIKGESTKLCPLGFMLGKELVFIDRMQFLNSILEILAKILVKDEFKCLSQEFQKNNKNIFTNI